MQLETDLLGAIDRPFLLEDIPGPIGVAVSGGGDSVALLCLMVRWAAANGRELCAVTVDHGLRPEAAEEAAFVAALCADLDVSHRVLRWQGWDGQGNLQAAARNARYDLIAEWAKGQGIGCVALGHTLDDQAETVLMRLARGSGVDGLSGMKVHRRARDLLWLRPLLTESRDRLRAYLRQIGQDWIDDPSNDDPGFDRVKARRALEGLADLGITIDGLAETAYRMRLASTALVRLAEEVAETCLTLDRGDAVFDLRELHKAPYETHLRLMAAALCWVSGQPYRPRLIALQDLMGQLPLEKPQTLHGALVTRGGDKARVTREYNAVAGLSCPTSELWDGRWRLDGPHAEGLEIRALGPALSSIENWRDTGLPRRSLLAAPAVWAGDRLVAAPLAGWENGWHARIVTSFDTFLVSH